MYWPLERALGTVLAWNAFVLLGFLGAGGLAACGWGSSGYAEARRSTGGLAFALAPYLQAQWSAGHLLAWSALLLPLSLYALERARRGSRWWLALAGAALASIPLSGQLHLSLAAITFFCGYALVRLRWAALLGAPAIAAGLVAYVLAVRDTTGASGRQFRQVEHFSASASDFFSRNTDDLEQVVYLGLTVVGLAARRAHRPRLTAATRPRPGPRPGRSRPDPLRARSHLPGYETVWRHLPGLHHTRVPERLMPVACLALAALLAIALSRLPWPGIAAMAALLLVVELPLGMFNETAADENNGAYAALRDKPPTIVKELPVFRSGEQLREHVPLLPDTGSPGASLRVLDYGAARGRPGGSPPAEAVTVPGPCRCSASATSSSTTVRPTPAAERCSRATARSRATECADCIDAGRLMADT